jgi:Tol biopolymer transport system component/DNA-binding winged helix-turn-helix (wHTH) protein
VTPVPGRFIVGEWTVSPSLHSVSGPAGEIRLEPKVMQVLVLLAEDAGQVVSKERLLQTVWADTFVGDEVLSRAISELRRAFADDAKTSGVIQTIPKGGYRLVAPVRFDPCEDAGDVSTQAGVATPTRRTWPLQLLLMGVVGGAAVLLLALAVTRPRPAPPAPTPRSVRAVPFTSFPGVEGSPSFSPDGSRVAFYWSPGGNYESRIFVRLTGNDPPQQLTDGPRDMFPSWSPDGKLIAFTRVDAAESGGLYTVAALGGPARRILSISGLREYEVCIPQPRWSPAGRELVVAIPHGQTCRLELLSLETFSQRVLTSPPASMFDDVPAFSPDGRSIAFVRHRNPFIGDLFTMPVEGGAPTRLTRDDAMIVGQLAWSPDGQIIFSSDRAGSPSLMRVAAAGGSPVPLPIGESATSPALDSSGRRLAYVNGVRDVQIFELDLTRPGDALQMIAPSSRDDVAPQISPDGRQLAFASARAGRSTDIWVANADGSNPFRLTFNDRFETGSPRWSPDGQLIAFDSSVNDMFHVFVVRAVGGSARRLTDDPSSDAVPAWSRDGRWIYFWSLRTGSSQIWKVPFAGGPAVQVTTHGGFDAFESSDGYLYYGKGEEAGSVWRMPVGGGREEPVLEHALNYGYSRCWAVVSDGIYFLAAADPVHPSVSFFSFATRQRTVIAPLPKMPKPFDATMSVSPDERRLLVALQDTKEADIMLAENPQ